MYKNGVEMQVTDNPAGRAVLLKQGWTESEAPAEAPKKRGRPKKVVTDDDSK